MLYIVATPIGNLSDITLRAIEILRTVDLIACEDTRQTKKLLSHYQIDKPLTSYYEHNKFQKGDYLLGLLKQGRSIALVSDSGTPGISDPGFHITMLALESNIKVVPIPGPCALVTALSVSGLPSDRFIFEGFLPIKPGPRRKKLQQLKEQQRTIVLYESPHRFIKLLNELTDIFPDAKVTVVREATKKFEEIKKGHPKEILEFFNTRSIKGEFAVVINNRGNF